MTFPSTVPLLWTMLHATVSSPVGPLYIEIENDAVIRLDFDDKEMSDFFTENALYSLLELPQKASTLTKPTEQTSADTTNEERLLAQTVRELAEYFQGKRQSFEVHVRLSGTEFRRRTWRRLEAIPFGLVKSYGDIANELNLPKASRAVGSACSSNPVAIIIPCHRVVGSTGKLTGFGGGLKRKDFLLKLESKQLPFQPERSAFERQIREVKKNRHPTR